jgi:hypothetical protein
VYNLSQAFVPLSAYLESAFHAANVRLTTQRILFTNLLNYSSISLNGLFFTAL